MSKKFVIPFIIFILLIGGYFLFFSSNVPQAQLLIEEGQVLVNGNSVSSNVILKEGDTVKTNNGKASIILYESITISLEPNSEVSIEDLLNDKANLVQESGGTWNTITDLAGVKEYSLTSGDSVATVRGTEFYLSQGDIITSEGTVEFKTANGKVNVGERESATSKNGNIEKREFNSDDLVIVRRNKQRAIEVLQKLRDEQIERSPGLVKAIQKVTGMSKEELRVELRSIDEGQRNIDELVSKSPVRTDSIQRLAKITKEIQKRKRLLTNL